MDPYMKTKTLDKSNCLRVAIYNNNLCVIKYLIEEFGMDVDKKCLLDASIYQNLDIIKYFVEDRKMDIMYEDDDGHNCLMIACAHNPNVEVIKYLINGLKMDTQKTNIDGSNCLTLSLHFNKNFNVTRYLIESTTISINSINLLNFEIDKYISILEILRKNPQRINEYVKIGVKKYGPKCVFKKENNKNIHHVNPLIFDNESRKLTGINGFKFKFDVFMMFANKLGCQLMLENLIDFCSDDFCSDDLCTSDYNDNDIIIEKNELLFYNNGKPYYGSKKIVYESILLLNDTGFLSYNDEEPIILSLSVDVPQYIMELYIDSCYDKIFEMNKVNKEDYVKFLTLTNIQQNIYQLNIWKYN